MTVTAPVPRLNGFRRSDTPGRRAFCIALIKEFGTVNQIDCRKPNELMVGELINWRVQKLTLH